MSLSGFKSVSSTNSVSILCLESWAAHLSLSLQTIWPSLQMRTKSTASLATQARPRFGTPPQLSMPQVPLAFLCARATSSTSPKPTAVFASTSSIVISPTESTTTRAVSNMQNSTLSTATPKIYILRSSRLFARIRRLLSQTARILSSGTTLATRPKLLIYYQELGGKYGHTILSGTSPIMLEYSLTLSEGLDILTKLHSLRRAGIESSSSQWQTLIAALLPETLDMSLKNQSLCSHIFSQWPLTKRPVFLTPRLGVATVCWPQNRWGQ